MQSNELYFRVVCVYLRVLLYQIFLECICSDHKSWPRGSLLAKHMHCPGCSPSRPSLSLSLHSLSGIWGLCLMAARAFTRVNRFTKESALPVTLPNSLTARENGERSAFRGLLVS